MTQFQQQPYQPYPVGGPPVQPQPPKKKRRWPWVVGGIAVVFVVIGVAANAGSGSGTTDAATTTPAATASSYAPEPTQGDVSVPTDLVGQTLAAASTELTNLGFDQYQIMSSPGLQSTVESCQADVTTCKTLKVTNVDEAGQSLQPSTTITITVEAVTPPGGATTITDDGTYVVGKEIAPGTWHTDGQGTLGSCYWERDKNLDGDFDSIITNDNIDGPTTIMFHSSDKAFKVDGGCTWTKE